MIELSLIIPAFNEEERIEKSLIKAIEFLNDSGWTYEILVVDDGSNDKTVEICEKYSPKVKTIKQSKNIGKGAAVRRGMLEAQGKYRVFTDADFSTPIYELNKVFYKLNSGFDICIGSRALDYSMVKEHQPFYRESMGKIFNKIVQFLVLKGITDTQCGFKAFSDIAAERIFSNAKINGFSFDVEALFLAQKFGFKIEQVSVEWYNDGRSKVNPIIDSFNMILELLKIKKLHSSI